MNNNHKEKKCVRKLREKEFSERKSLITELLELKHFKSIRHIFYSILFGFVANDIIKWLFTEKRVSFGFRLIAIGFAKFHLVIITWSIMFCVNLLTFLMFKLWADNRIAMTPRRFTTKAWDFSFLTVFILYYAYSLYLIPVVAISTCDLPSISSVILVVEQVRLLMKSHAFVRSNAPEILNYKPHSETVLIRPKLLNYLYFSFAPTLVYRHAYPRTKEIKKSHAVVCFVEVLVLIWIQSFVFDSFFVSKFENTGKSEINWARAFVIIMENIVPGMLVLLFNFYLVLHTWQNGFAEILRFADRRFYEDWWTATNFAMFFRTWNIVVQDWLFTYIYKDFYEVITPNNKFIPKFMVFFISAVVHEYVLIFMLRQFFPLLFINFFFAGMLFSYIDTKHPVFNVFFLYAMMLGMSIQISLYTMEFYARGNCPVLDKNLTSHLTPRIFSSDCL